VSVTGASRWQTIVDDARLDTVVLLYKALLSGSQCDVQTNEVLRSSISQLPWEDTKTSRNVILRKSCWLTAEACSCNYKYGGRKWDRHDIPVWLQDLTNIIEEASGLSGYFNSINCNLYEDGDQHLTWHSDGETLFRTHDDNFDIASLSFGASRAFLIKENFMPDDQAYNILLESGDLLLMKGKCQKHFQHKVQRGSKDDDVRINLTWRRIVQHHPYCKCFSAERQIS
jgi:alkylated DNA repair dioxygenase AlkB